MKTITALAIATLKLREYIQIDVPEDATDAEIEKALAEEAASVFAQSVQLSNDLKLNIDIVDSEEAG